MKLSNESQKEKKKRDRAWREAVKARDKVCQVCGEANKRLNAHHLIPRQFIEFRWDIRNGMLLCVRHHNFGKESAHKHPIWFARWLQFNKPEIYDWIVMRI